MREEFESYAKKHLGFRKNQFSKYIDGSYKNEQLRVYSEIWEASAWHAFQEQQKKIEQLLEIVNTGLKIEHNMNNQIHSLKEKIDTAIEYLDSIEGLVWYEQIKELLK